MSPFTEIGASIGGGRARGATSLVHPVDDSTEVVVPRSDPAPAIAGVPIDFPTQTNASRWGKRYAGRLLVTDFLALIWAGVGVHVVHFNDLRGDRLSTQAGSVPLVALTTALAVVWFGALTVGGTRLPVVVGHGATEYKRIAQISLSVFGAVAILSYLLDLRLPRTYLLIMMPAGLMSLILSRYVWRRWLHARRDFGHYQSAVLAVGSVPSVTDLVRELKRSPRAGYRVVAVCLTQPLGPDAPTSLDGLPIVGGIDDVKDAVLRIGVDTVAITESATIGPSAVRRLSWQLEDTQAGLVLAPALTDIAGPRIHTQPVNGLPLIHVDKPTYRGANRLLKKTFDMVLASLLLLLFSVPLAVIAASVKLSSTGPIFFRQARVGINGQMFRMIKFRSMVVDAEARLAELQAQRGAGEAGNVVLFKMKHDPRVTPIGRILRRLSLDELPQLFNVLGGTMSLVGPRPPLADEVAQYESDARRRLLVKPGMTGLWQVSGRSNLNWEETMRLDSYYVENWSITGDLVILWKTARAVAGGGGAF
ncbi:MAG: sugar transferase [Actinomycetota bacterium]|nr:sugar transferase [Actinomycetota bacterium]